MSHSTSALFRGRPARPVAATAPRHAWRRAAFILLAAGLDTAAAVMLVSRHLPEAALGVLLAGLGWLATRRLAAWYPAPSPVVAEEAARR
ncbi:hypothetical protein [Streptomyces sp. Ru72]|uniref:hypothetical protein n=1 Tax=Streptomyces sp. Ru72 TaxID=2080747 RepID=UPI000CDD77A1|nr:hypothetical protein [Streptomyces sp. Ru72]POX45118.1 hypothetical protein C3488_30675 [Streptomyces sp. Ru72]